MALVGATAAWGSSFIIIKGAVARMPVADFLALRFALAAVALGLLRPRALGRLTRSQLRRAVALGLVYASAQLLQTVGLEHTSAAISGFVTGMYVVFTPLLGLVAFGQRTGARMLAAIALATVGLGVLSLHGLSVGEGVALTLASALAYAIHIVGLGAWSDARAAYGMATVQMATVSLVSGVFALPGHLALPSSGAVWWRIVFTALGAGALALLAQTWAQAHLDPSRAAVIMTLEPVFAAAFAIGFGGEPITWRLSGGVLLLGAMYLAETGRSQGPSALHTVAPHLAEGG